MSKDKHPILTDFQKGMIVGGTVVLLGFIVGWLMK